MLALSNLARGDVTPAARGRNFCAAQGVAPDDATVNMWHPGRGMSAETRREIAPPTGTPAP